MNELEKSTLIRQFEEKMKNIDQIAKLAIQERQKKITEKYGNIQSTAKILKGLIIQFTKKSMKIEQELRQAARIDDLKYQTQYHINRLQLCLKLSSNLQNLITAKKAQIHKNENQSKKLKEELILIKTENIKKILKIEMIENLQNKNVEREKKQKRMQTIKQKMQQNRALMRTGLNYTPSTIDLLKKQKQELSTSLWQKINKKLTISKYLFENYEFLKLKLIKQEKKSNVYGLNGSLFFKLQQNTKLENRIGPTIGRKNKFDHKLLIYDVLKQKHSNQIKSQKIQQNQISVQLEEFLNFTPIQIMGLIQLKGGISYLRKNCGQFFIDIKPHISPQKTHAKGFKKVR